MQTDLTQQILTFKHKILSTHTHFSLFNQMYNVNCGLILSAVQQWLRAELTSD